MTSADPLLDRQGLADHLGLALATVDRYRHDGRLPPPDVTLGRAPGWHVSTIEAWQAERPGAGARTDLLSPTVKSVEQTADSCWYI